MTEFAMTPEPTETPAEAAREMVDALEQAAAGSMAVTGSAMQLMFAEMRALAALMPGLHPVPEPMPDEGGDENVPV
jgi:hypothetical protein